MRELLARAGTILFVSHSLRSVREFCDRAIWLESGRIAAIGSAEDVVAEYSASVSERAED